jgi:hypothetical protein
MLEADPDQIYLQPVLPRNDLTSHPLLLIPLQRIPMAKRKNQSPANGQAKKKRAISDDEAHKNFRDGLFDSKVLEGYTSYYAESRPYAPITIVSFNTI